MFSRSCKNYFNNEELKKDPQRTTEKEKIYPAYLKNINVGIQFNGKQYC